MPHPGLMCRCGRLRTLVLALDDLPREWGMHEGRRFADLIARLPSLAVGAPRLRALQLVLPMLGGEGGAVEKELEHLWRGLEALRNLASLALGWVFMEDEDAAYKGERIACVLDAAQVGPAESRRGAFVTCKHVLHTGLCCMPDLASAPLP